MRLGGAVSEYNSYDLLRCADARDKVKSGSLPLQQTSFISKTLKFLHFQNTAAKVVIFL